MSSEESAKQSRSKTDSVMHPQDEFRILVCACHQHAGAPPPPAPYSYNPNHLNNTQSPGAALSLGFISIEYHLSSAYMKKPHDFKSITQQRASRTVNCTRASLWGTPGFCHAVHLIPFPKWSSALYIIYRYIKRADIYKSAGWRYFYIRSMKQRFYQNGY